MSNKDTKLVTCNVYGRIEEVSKFVSPKNFICKECREKKQYFEGPFHCLTCGKEFEEDYRKTSSKRKAPPRFCSDSCAKKYSASFVNINITKTKTVRCIECGKETQVPAGTGPKACRCEDCKKERKYLISKIDYLSDNVIYKKLYSNKELKEILNNLLIEKDKIEFISKYPKDCILGRFERSQAYKQKAFNLIKLGFDFNNSNWEEEFFKVRNKLYQIYYVEKQSILMIQKLFDFKSTRTVTDYLKLFGFNKIRDLKEGQRLAIETGRSVPLNNLPGSANGYQYHNGWYTLKNNKKVFYRSSYELFLIEYFESRNIEFELNTFRIKYISSKDNTEHFGYPDFYLPQYNLVIETKSERFFDEENINDRYNSLKEQRLDFIVISFDAKNFNILKQYISINDERTIENTFKDINEAYKDFLKNHWYYENHGMHFKDVV